MATIYDRGTDWHLVIAPGAKPVKEINEPDKGYSATLGEDPETGKHVVMDVHYNKDKYTLNDVEKFVEKSRTCPGCEALDKEKMRLQAIELREPDIKREEPSSTPVLAAKEEPKPKSIAQPAAAHQPLSPLKDIFANVFFDAYLTTPGKYFLGLMLNDDRILESAMPKQQDDIPQFMDEMVDFLAGKTDFVRSPDEVKEYLSVLKKDDSDSTTAQRGSGSRRKKRESSQTILVY